MVIDAGAFSGRDLIQVGKIRSQAAFVKREKERLRGRNFMLKSFTIIDE